LILKQKITNHHQESLPVAIAAGGALEGPMRKIFLSLILLLMLPCGLLAEQSVYPPNPASRPELGKWWKNSQAVRTLELSESQVSQIEQIFLNHRRELNDLSTALRLCETDLKMLMMAETVDDAKVMAQTEAVASARATLERANTSMMLSIRKALSKGQWDKLEVMRVSKDFYTMDGSNKPPRAIYRPVPQYTEAARSARIQGIVVLQGMVRKDGSIDSIKVLRGLGYGLTEQAINKVLKEWRFEPGTSDGQPVDVEATIEISFRLF
jgi:TonB family protein